MIKISNNHILALIAAMLAITCVMSVCSPIRFERQQAGREQAVKERLVKICRREIPQGQRHLQRKLRHTGQRRLSGRLAAIHTLRRKKEIRPYGNDADKQVWQADTAYGMRSHV